MIFNSQFLQSRSRFDWSPKMIRLLHIGSFFSLPNSVKALKSWNGNKYKWIYSISVCCTLQVTSNNGKTKSRKLSPVTRYNILNTSFILTRCEPLVNCPCLYQPGEWWRDAVPENLLILQTQTHYLTNKVPTSSKSSTQLRRTVFTCTIPTVNCTYGHQPPTEFTLLVTAALHGAVLYLHAKFQLLMFCTSREITLQKSITK